jgi:hypothetical protein
MIDRRFGALGGIIRVRSLSADSIEVRTSRGQQVRFRLSDLQGAMVERFRDKCSLRVLGQGQVLGEFRNLPAGRTMISGFGATNLDLIQQAGDFISDLARSAPAPAPATAGDPVTVRCGNCGAQGQTQGQACCFCAVVV